MEYFVQSALHPQGVHGHADQPQRQTIVNDIEDIHPASGRLQMVLVMPEPVGTAALFIDKVVRRLYVGYFGHPGDSDTADGANPVGNDQAGIDSVRHTGGDGEIQPGRRDQAQIGRIREEAPGLIKIGGQGLVTFDAVGFHKSAHPPWGDRCLSNLPIA